MLLRRVIDHVKTQNWTAVALDFFIVVVGVFIGIQVANWNDARSDKVLARDYLGQLSVDIDTTINILNEHIDRHKGAMSAIADFLSMQSENQTPTDQISEAIKVFLDEGCKAPTFRPVETSFQDLTFSGKLHLIEDLEHKDSLVSERGEAISLNYA